MRAGSECAVNTTWASVPRTRSASTSTKPGSLCQLSTKRSSARLASARSRCLTVAADELGEPRQHVGIGLRKDTVAEVEDVARPSAGPAQDVERRPLRPLPRAEQNGGLEIALNRPLFAKRRPGVVYPDAPVDADRGSAGGRHLREQLCRRARSEVDRRNAGGLEHAGRIRPDELPVVGAGEHA